MARLARDPVMLKKARAALPSGAERPDRTLTPRKEDGGQ